METKEALISNIKEWVKLDNEISQFKKQIKERNDCKKKLTDNLITTMKNNEIDCFDINGGAIIYKQSKVKKPLRVMDDNILVEDGSDYDSDNIFS
jgi:hypothetical protein